MADGEGVGEVAGQIDPTGRDSCNDKLELKMIRKAQAMMRVLTKTRTSQALRKTKRLAVMRRKKRKMKVTQMKAIASHLTQALTHKMKFSLSVVDPKDTNLNIEDPPG